MRRNAKYILVTVAYLTAVLAARAAVPATGPVPPLWPAAGIGFAALYALGPTAAIAVFVAQCISGPLLGHAPSTSLLIALCITTGLSLGALTTRRLLGNRDPFSGIRTISMYFGAGVLPSALGASLGGAWALQHFSTTPQFALGAWTLFLSGFTGIAILAPLIEAWRRRPPDLPHFLRSLEGWLLMAAAVFVSWLVFGLNHAVPLVLFPLPFALIPVTAWATFRADSRTLTLILALLYVLSVLCTIAKFGPFGHYDTNLGLELLQVFTVVSALTTCTIHAMFRESSRAFTALKENEAALREAKGELERRVADRTRKLAEALEELRDAEENYRTLFENASEGIYRTDTSGRFTRVNPGLARMLGYASPTELRESITDLSRQTFTRPEDRHRLYQALTQSGQITDFEAPMRRRDGAHIWVSLSVRPVMGGDGRILGTEGFIQDITQRKLSEEELERRATLDALTGIANRRTFERSFETMLAQAERTDTGLALLFIDLDDFKTVNDTLGHQAGDDLLCETARRIAARLRRSDLLARLGGDEFTVLLHNVTDPEKVRGVAADIIKSLSQPFELDGQKATIGASIGASIFPTCADTSDALLKSADKAMYKAKERGKNRYHIDIPTDVIGSA